MRRRSLEIRGTRVRFGVLCVVRSGTDAMTDAVAHSLACGRQVRNFSSAVDPMVAVICTEKNELVVALAASPVSLGVVEYRFDEQPAVREQWQVENRTALSVEAAAPILAGMANAARFRMRLDGETTEINLIATAAADAVAAFRDRCSTLPAPGRGWSSG